MAIGFWGLQFLIVGFRGPSVAMFSRYSYRHYCACVTTPHTNVYTGAVATAINAIYNCLNYYRRKAINTALGTRILYSIVTSRGDRPPYAVFRAS